MHNLEKIFSEATGLTGNQRDSFLEENCPTDEVRQRVQVLLKAHDQAQSFLEQPPISLPDGDTRCFVDTEKRVGDETTLPLLNNLQPLDDPEQLGRLGDYEVDRVIGRGGMGIVLKANDTKLNRTVAIKVLPWSLTSDEKLRRRFMREAQTAAQLSHPNIVTVHSVEDSQTPFIVMEFVPGESLQDRLGRVGRLPAADIVAIAQQIAEGLVAAHAKDLIHRDIKPSNILIDPDGRVKIADFGLARAAYDGELTQGEILGTPQFMSPEQTSGERIDHRTDLFSLGSVMYAMCTGRAPFIADSMLGVFHQVREHEPEVIEATHGIPPALANLIHWLMAKAPEDRIQTAHEVCTLLEAIDPLADANEDLHKDATLQPPKALEANPNTRFRRTAIFGFAVSLLLMLGVSELSGWTRFGSMLVDVFRIETPQGTLVVTVYDPDVKVNVDGKTISVNAGGPNEFHYDIGEYTVEATKGEEVILRKVVSITRDGEEIVSIEKEMAESDGIGTGTIAATERSEQPRWIPIVGEPVTLQGHDHFVLSVAYSTDGKKLASVQFGGRVIVWNLSNQAQLFQVSTGEQNPYRIRFSPDGSRVVCGKYQWNAETGEPLESLAEPILCWSDDGSAYAALSASSVINVYKSVGGELLHSINTNQIKVNGADFSADGRWVATAGNENAKIWDVLTGERVALLRDGDNPVHSVAFSPEGSRLVTVGEDQLAKVWEWNEPESPKDRLLFKLAGHRDSVAGVEFLPAGQHFITVSRESAITYPAPGKPRGKSIKIWDVDSGEEIWNQSGHQHNVTGLDVRKDGLQFATCSYDTTIKLWNLRQLPKKD